MKKMFREEIKDTKNLWPIWIGGGLWFLMLALFGVFYGKLPPEIPWFYSLSWGEERLIGKLWMGAVVGGLGILMVANIIIGLWLGKNEELIKRLMMWGGVGVVLLGFLSFIRVLIVVL